MNRKLTALINKYNAQYMAPRLIAYYNDLIKRGKGEVKALQIIEGELTAQYNVKQVGA